MFLLSITRYHESMLECCRNLDEIRKDGISFDELACLARCNSLNVTPKRPLYRHVYMNNEQLEPTIEEQKHPRKVFSMTDTKTPSLHSNEFVDHLCPSNMNSSYEQGKVHTIHPYDNYHSVEEFRSDVLSCCSRPDGPVVIISYSRKEFHQTGDGHFSPIGAYHRKEDKVLILDTARFKYPPHWIDLEMLYRSMCRLDPEKNLTRGWMILDVPHGIKKELSSNLVGNTSGIQHSKDIRKEELKEQEISSLFSNRPTSSSFASSPKYFSFFLSKSMWHSKQGMEDDLGFELIINPRETIVGEIFTSSAVDSTAQVRSNEKIDSQSGFYITLIEEVLKQLLVKVSKDLILKRSDLGITSTDPCFLCDPTFDESNGSEHSTNSKTSNLSSAIESGPTQRKRKSDVCVDKMNSVLRFSSPIAFRMKCCVEDFIDINGLMSGGTPLDQTSRKNSLKCPSKCTRDHYSGISKELQSTQLHGIIKQVINFNFRDSSIDRGAEMLTLLLFVLLEDEDLMEFDTILNRLDTNLLSTSIADVQKRSSILILRDICKFSSVECPELTKELQSLCSQWSILKNYCRVVMHLPVVI